MISKEEVKHIAKLARLGLTEKEREKMQKELSSILDYIEKLGDEDKSSSSATERAKASEGGKKGTFFDFAVARVKKVDISVENVMRNDEVRRLKPEVRRKIIEQAPETKAGYLKVKLILNK